MVTNDVLEAETQGRRRVAVVAGLAAILYLAPPIVLQAIIGTDPTDNALTRAMVQADNRTVIFLAAILSLLSLLGITYVLDFLLRAARARDTSIQPYVRILLLVGGIGLVLFTGVLQIVTAVRVEHWATNGSLTYDELKEASNYGVFVFFGLAAQLAFAFAFVLVSLNAMRVGLLTRFLGYLGVISAVLFVLAVLPLPIVQAYWLSMIALLLWNVRGAREPPAWAAGEAIAWPSQAELREQRVRTAEARRAGSEPEPVGRGDDAEPTADIFEGDEEADETDATGRPIPANARRKRKKRR